MGKRSTLIIFDFDDTLFPTSFLAASGYTHHKHSDLPDDLQQEMSNVEQASIKLLLEARKYGKVKIVSNGGMDWISEACEEFTPCLWNVIKGLSIEVISARDRYEGKSEDLSEWKRKVFSKLLRKMKCRVRPCRKALTLISVGDSSIDRNATLNCEGIVPIDGIKFVKFERSISTETLTLQLNRTSKMISELATLQQHADIKALL